MYCFCGPESSKSKVFRKPKLAFMDKLTIPQEDEKLKEQCILGLAGFLQRSETLVILWSESYIGRVWWLGQGSNLNTWYFLDILVFQRIWRSYLQIQVDFRSSWGVSMSLLHLQECIQEREMCRRCQSHSLCFFCCMPHGGWQSTWWSMWFGTP